MDDPFQLSDFLSPSDIFYGSTPLQFREGQIGRYISAYQDTLPDITQADIVLVGCGEYRGDIEGDFDHAGPDAIRRSFYSLFHWHRQIRIADLGNIKSGHTLADTYAALRTVVSAIIETGAKAVILGGSHDLTLAQYDVYRSREAIIDVAVIDARIDLSMDIPVKSCNFLMEMLTGEPNFIRHYNHIAFQSYLVHPDMLETLDKLRFDCYRLGHMREDIDEIEPVLRNCRMASIDMAALQYMSAPHPDGLPNGLNGEEACLLSSFAGMGSCLDSLGIYGYHHETDTYGLASRQIAQMIWYFMDGVRKGKEEPPLSAKDEFLSFHTAFAELETIFLQSRRTGRWWMRLPEGNFIPCSRRDYLRACDNQLPERWLRAQERI